MTSRTIDNPKGESMRFAMYAEVHDWVGRVHSVPRGWTGSLLRDCWPIRFVEALKSKLKIQNTNNVRHKNVTLAPPGAFWQFPDTPFPLLNGPFRIKWNYLLLSHQRKVVDTAQDSQKVRKEWENVNHTDWFKLQIFKMMNSVNRDKAKSTKWYMIVFLFFVFTNRVSL